MKTYNVGIVGATGMVGQRFVKLLAEHPWFRVKKLAASPRSAGKTYQSAVAGRWAFDRAIPDNIAGMTVLDAANAAQVAEGLDIVFCAVEMGKDETRALEDAYAKAEVAVISNNSAHRHTPDVPMMVPEINPEHAAVIAYQRARLGTTRGFVVVKPNCSIQGYVPALSALRDFGISAISVCTYQAVSGAGKTLASWPEMNDNVIPYIGDEEEKSEWEPLKIWGAVKNGEIVPAQAPIISAQCYRVPVSDGHMAAVSVKFDGSKPSIDEIISRWAAYKGEPQELNLPGAPKQFLTYFNEDNRPQTKLDRDIYGGMGIACGRLRTDNIFDYKFCSLSHNTLRGAAGGGVLTAEYLCAKGFI